MKKITALTVLPLTLSLSAFAEPSLYGRASVAIQSADEGTESITEVTSNASRLGVKGKHGVVNGLTAMYQVELEVYYDEGDKDGQTLTQRNTFVGLQGGFGAVKAGKFDSPFKTAQKKVDLFSDLEGDIRNIISINEKRPSNIVSYATPSLSGFKGTVAFIAGEKDEDGNTKDDGVSSSITFEQDDLYLAVALDSGVIAEDVDAMRVVAQYTIGAFQLGGLYETVDAPAVDDTDGAFFSVKYSVNKWAFKAQVGQSDIDELDGETMSVGFDYKLAKPVKIYTYYTALESDSTDADYLGVGMQYDF